MTNRSTPDIGLRYLGHVDSTLYPGCRAEAFQRVLQGETVHYRGQHAHVVGLGRVHTVACTLYAAPDVATAHHHRDVYIEVALHRDNIGCDSAHGVAVDAVFERTRERLTRQLQKDPVPSGSVRSSKSFGGVTHSYVPITT